MSLRRVNQIEMALNPIPVVVALQEGTRRVGSGETAVDRGLPCPTTNVIHEHDAIGDVAREAHLVVFTTTMVMPARAGPHGSEHLAKPVFTDGAANHRPARRTA